jgi:hypothetical protein
MYPRNDGQRGFVFGARQMLEEDYDPPLCLHPSWDLHCLDQSCICRTLLDRLNHVPLRSRRVWNMTYSTGTTKMPIALAAIIPVKTGVPTSCRLIWAAPWATTSG